MKTVKRMGGCIAKETIILIGALTAAPLFIYLSY